MGNNASGSNSGGYGGGSSEPKSLIKRLFPSKEVRILMLGLDCAGKTTILYKIKMGKVVRTIPTIGELAGWLVGYLAGWLSSCLAGLLVGWLVGWLVGSY